MIDEQRSSLLALSWGFATIMFDALRRRWRRRS
jgi:hypothetical protein